jgi:hypothetical protein
MATMSTDNVWIQSQDKAIKAGRLLGQVLEKRVQGQRPVVLASSTRSGREFDVPADPLLMYRIDRTLSGSFDRLPRLTIPLILIVDKPTRDR